MTEPVNQVFLILGSMLGGTAVILGAFAAHGLQGVLNPASLEIWNTATRYQMYHALAVILIACLATRSPQVKLLTVAGFSFLAGVIIFSGSLYALSLSGLKWLGAITPLGGLILILGWIILAISARQLK